MAALRKLLALKPGIRTSEFWSHAIVSVISLLVAIGLVPVGLPNHDQTWVQLGAFVAAALTSGLYALSRGKVKAGSSSLVTLLDHAITAQLSGADPALGRGLLGKVFPELPASDAAQRLLTGYGSGTVAVGLPSTVTTGFLQTSDPASSVNEVADGTTDSGPGGFPADVATEPVAPTPDAAVAMPAPIVPA